MIITSKKTFRITLQITSEDLKSAEHWTRFKGIDKLVKKIKEVKNEKA